MGVFKEEANTFENVARKQTRIYNDVAAYGYPYNTAYPPSDITRLIDSVSEFKGIDKNSASKRKFIRNREQWSGGVSVTIRIAWEMDEGYYVGTQYVIFFNKTPKQHSLINKDCNAFISVDISRYQEKII